MDKDAFHQTVEDLRAVNPDLAKLADMDSSAKWVLLIEACNFAAKEALVIFKSERDRFKASRPTVKQIPEDIKAWDLMSGRLMKAAKNLLLPEAVQNGAEIFRASDDSGQPVLLLRHPDAGMISIHGVNLEKMDNPTLKDSIKPQDEGAVFTGFRRQRLADILAKAANGDKGLSDPIVQSIRRASVDKPFADAVNHVLSAEAEPTKDQVIGALLQQNNLG